MSAPWAMRIPLDSAAAAGLLRCTAGIQALLAPDAFWLRGELLTEAIDDLLRRIPGDRFTRSKGGEAELLVPVGRKLPVAPLPAGQWMALEQALVLKVPASLTPAAAPPQVPLCLVASDAQAAPNLLLARRQHWSEWVETAPSVRLDPLAFALSDSQAVIRGTPLPALPGTRYVEAAGVAIPCGFQVSPALDAATLAQVMGLRTGDVALMRLDASCEVLPAEVFVPASRSAVRCSDAAGGTA